MPAGLDLTGKRFGRLVAIARAPSLLRAKASGRPRRATAWVCRCDCGTEITVQTINLRAGDTSSCGCLKHEWAVRHGERLNLLLRERATADPEKWLRAHRGEKWGRLTIEAEIGRGAHDQRRCRCLCECGQVWEGEYHRLVSGTTQSCGCLRAHGRMTREQVCERARRGYAKAMEDPEFKEARRDRMRALQLWREYRMTPEQFRALVEFQAGRCAVCLRILPIDRLSESRRGRSPIHVDHDHISGEIRGILCYACNQGLGLYEDAPDRLRRAAAYLERPPARLAFGIDDGEQLAFPQLRVVRGWVDP